MNDRFKFRVWDKRKNNYIKDFVFNFINKSPYITVEYFDNEYAYTHTFEEDEIIPEQCTGLKDKNGKLIYENDFIQAKNENIYLIKWCQEKLGFVARTNSPDDVLESLDISSYEWEVIGNIHENPDLLENKDDQSRTDI